MKPFVTALQDDATVVLDHQHDEAAEARFELIMEYFRARRDISGEQVGEGAPYRPVPPDRLYFDDRTWRASLAMQPTLQLFFLLFLFNYHLHFCGSGRFLCHVLLPFFHFFESFRVPLAGLDCARPVL